MISLKKFFRSLKYALQGLRIVARHEHSFRLQLFGLVVIVVFIFVLDLAAWEQIILILLSAAVLIMEVLNSIVERITDGLKPRLSPIVKEVKDMMAGAVLLTVITATIIGFMILIPALAELL
jgi:diacylglycerol kinase